MHDRQADMPSPDENMPATQLVHAVGLSGDPYDPAVHVTHTVPERAAAPVAQLEHPDDPATSATVLPAQLKQPVRPCTDVYVPDTQLKQIDAPANEL